MIKALFVDIGGCLLTNGLDGATRAKLASEFKLDPTELAMRHEIFFDALETDRISFESYLEKVIFYEKRTFTKKAFEEAVYAYSQPFSDMINLIKEFKASYSLKVFAVNNEGRVLNEYRRKKFALDSFIDLYFSSCYVHLRKPDLRLYTLALDVTGLAPHEVLYIEDRPAFVLAAKLSGINAICHKDYAITKNELYDSLKTASRYR